MIKKVLIIIPFYEIYPPMNGGMLRCINILNQVSKYFEVTAIIYQDRKSFLKAVDQYPAIGNCTIISTTDKKHTVDIFSFLPLKISKALRFRYWNRSLKGPAGEDFLLIYPILIELLKKTFFDYAILEDISLLNIAKVIRRYQPNISIIYDAHNVNTSLVKAAIEAGKATKANYTFIKGIECDLSKIVDLVFTCSQQDLMQLKTMNNNHLNGVIVPNGVAIRHSNIGNNDSDNILFCGSLDYLPNQNGLIWFIERIFPLILAEKPSTNLIVIGKGDPGTELLQSLKHNAVIYYGKVDSVSDYYKDAAVAVVPLLSGSGTRLKLLEAMSFRVAVVSTTIGAEGIAYTDKKNILIADSVSSFARCIMELLNNKAINNDITNEAFLFVKKEYDWDIIGERLQTYFL